MWIDDSFPSTRAFTITKSTGMDKFIDSEEFDLGVVDLIDVKLELLKHKEKQLASAK